jgi:Xaa-Pro aminopeptidase
MDEVDEKTDRLARLAHAEGLGGILLNTQANFSWLTGGRSNRVDGSREGGSGSLLVSARGQRYVVANNIEMPRLNDEALAGLRFTPCEYAWTEEHGNPRRSIEVAHDVLGGGLVGCDGALAGDRPLDAHVTATRALLTDAELPRYRALGRDIGRALGETCRTLVVGLEETEIAKRVAVAVACAGARAIVTLVAADERIARYRHPLPTNARWKHTVLVAVCAQRDGLVVALSRIVTNGASCDALEARTVATARVFERLLEATRPGVTGAELFTVATNAYAEANFAGEEALHHQGGAIGYRSRDWVAHPRSRDRVQRQQAFAWNPSITGTKVEDTVLVTADGIENLTPSPDWPQIPLRCNGLTISAAGLLALI